MHDREDHFLDKCLTEQGGGAGADVWDVEHRGKEALGPGGSGRDGGRGGTRGQQRRAGPDLGLGSHWGRRGASRERSAPSTSRGHSRAWASPFPPARPTLGAPEMQDPQPPGEHVKPPQEWRLFEYTQWLVCPRRQAGYKPSVDNAGTFPFLLVLTWLPGVGSVSCWYFSEQATTSTSGSSLASLDSEMGEGVRAQLRPRLLGPPLPQCCPADPGHPGSGGEGGRLGQRAGHALDGPLQDAVKGVLQDSRAEASGTCQSPRGQVCIPWPPGSPSYSEVGKLRPEAQDMSVEGGLLIQCSVIASCKHRAWPLRLFCLLLLGLSPSLCSGA